MGPMSVGALGGGDRDVEALALEEQSSEESSTSPSDESERVALFDRNVGNGRVKRKGTPTPKGCKGKGIRKGKKKRRRKRPGYLVQYKRYFDEGFFENVRIF